MSCPCRVLRLQLALYVGQDERSLPEELRRQVAVCPECRQYFKQLKTSIHLLQDHEGDDQSRLEKSLWPDLAKRMPQRRRHAGRLADRASLYISASAITVACLALFLVPFQDLDSPSAPVMTNPAVFPATPSGFQMRSTDPFSGTSSRFFDRLLEEEAPLSSDRPATSVNLFAPAYQRR